MQEPPSLATVKDVMDALRQIIAAMTISLPDRSVQEVGCEAVEDAARLDAESAAEVGAVPVVIAAMRAHSSYGGVQRAGAAALCNLAVDEDVQREVIRAGAVPLVLAAMKEFPFNGDLQV